MLAIIKKVLTKDDSIAWAVIDTTDGVVEIVKTSQLLKLAKKYNLDIVGVSQDKSFIMDTYELTWRFDFDPTLNSVLSINGAYSKDKGTIDAFRDEFSYLRSLDSFIKESGMGYEFRNTKFKKMNVKYIEYVNVGFWREDGKYDFTQYWRTSENEIIFSCAGKDCPQDNGLFYFCNDTFPCLTRVFENGFECYDYRKDESHNKRLALEDAKRVAISKKKYR